MIVAFSSTLELLPKTLNIALTAKIKSEFSQRSSKFKFYLIDNDTEYLIEIGIGNIYDSKGRYKNSMYFHEIQTPASLPLNVKSEIIRILNSYLKSISTELKVEFTPLYYAIEESCLDEYELPKSGKEIFLEKMVDKLQEQVEDLKKEMAATNLKSQNLRRALDEAEKTSEELRILADKLSSIINKSN